MALNFLRPARPMERLVENTISIGVAEYQINVVDGDKVAITKVADSKKDFRISVNGGERLTYSVDTDINGGSSDKDLRKIMSSRMDKAGMTTLVKMLKVFSENREF